MRNNRAAVSWANKVSLMSLLAAGARPPPSFQFAAPMSALLYGP